MVVSGDRIPSVMVRRVDRVGVTPQDSAIWFSKGRVVMFTVPGAFTPTCHNDHLPGFVSNADAIRACGVDNIICATVNDHYVVAAWAQDRNALEKIDFLADFDASFAEAMGLARDRSTGGLGNRYLRSAIIIENGVVQNIFVQNNFGDDQPGQLTNTSASAILEILQGSDKQVQHEMSVA